MPEIISDNDLPKIANTAAKRVKWVKMLVAAQFGSTVKRLDNPPMQGMFSRTLFATLADKTELVIQLRTEVLDLEAFALARATLGEAIVPWVRELESEELNVAGVWAYAMERIPGQMWLRGVASKGAAGRVAINRSLGGVLARGQVVGHGTSDDALIKHVRPHLEAIVASPLTEIDPYRALYLNEVNVLIDPDQDCTVTGLIDWEHSFPLPLGVGLGRIHTLAGEYTEGAFWMPPEFVEAEKAFWNSFFDGIPDEEVKSQVSQQLVLVQEAVLLGTLLDTFFIEDGTVGVSTVSVTALSKFLTYRLPALRDGAPPYTI
ncbi:hypothetical protein SEUCBS140593_007234 [Sporothrix eucalyptigena]|uniref:Aminoglycoside phosphotransferase domain-containing protein n=1 Tax=Sporothrix eucalyptigena TaxID=1812306 RepID=A0ABP0CD84_9PEZI